MSAATANVTVNLGSGALSNGSASSSPDRQRHDLGHRERQYRLRQRHHHGEQRGQRDERRCRRRHLQVHTRLRRPTATPLSASSPATGSICSASTPISARPATRASRWSPVRPSPRRGSSRVTLRNPRRRRLHRRPGQHRRQRRCRLHDRDRGSSEPDQRELRSLRHPQHDGRQMTGLPPVQLRVQHVIVSSRGASHGQFKRANSGEAP